MHSTLIADSCTVFHRENPTKTGGPFNQPAAGEYLILKKEVTPPQLGLVSKMCVSIGSGRLEWLR